MSYTPPEVRYVTSEDGRSRHAEPELDQSWSSIEKLRWHASFVELESGFTVRVNPAKYSVGGVEQHGYYSINVNVPGISSGSGPYTYDGAWVYLNGLQAGAEYAKAVAS
jgi:hypothetical protein